MFTSEEEKATLQPCISTCPRFKALPLLPMTRSERLVSEAAVVIQHHDQGEVERLNQEDFGDCAMPDEETEKNPEDRDSRGPSPAKRRGSCALVELLGNT